MPIEITKAVDHLKVADFVHSLPKSLLTHVKGRISYLCTKRKKQDKRVSKDDKLICEVLHDIDGKKLSTLEELVQELLAREKERGSPKQGVYLTELRYQKKWYQDIEGGAAGYTKTVLLSDLKDRIKEPLRDLYVYWDRSVLLLPTSGATQS